MCVLSRVACADPLSVCAVGACSSLTSPGQELLANWNVNTNAWLKSSIFIRLAKPGKRPGAKSTMATFMVSAFWHGINVSCQSARGRSV